MMQEDHRPLPPVESETLSPTGRDILSVQQDISMLEERFGGVVENLFTSLTLSAEEQPSLILKIRAALLAVPLKKNMKYQHASFFDEHTSDIECATTIARFQTIICKYCNYLNVSLFELLVEKFGDVQSKASFKVYLQHLHDFTAKTTIGKFIDAQFTSEMSPALPPGFVEVAIELCDSWRDCTLHFVIDFHNNVCKEASFAPYAIYLKTGKWKCIILVYGIAKRAVSSIQLVLDEAGMARYNLRAVNYYTESLPISKSEVSLTDTEHIMDDGPPIDTASFTAPRDPMIKQELSSTVTEHESLPIDTDSFTTLTDPMIKQEPSVGMSPGGYYVYWKSLLSL